MDIIYKNINTIAENIDKQDDKGIVQIYVSSFNNIDSDNEIIRKGAFTKTITENMQRIKHLYNHWFDQLLGLPIEMIENEKGLLITSAMNIEKDMVKDVYSDYKFFKDHGRTLEHSIGFSIVKANIEKETNVRVITEVKLYEYSTLSFYGANENTPLTDIKSLENMLNYSYSDRRKKQIENILNQAVKENTLDEKPIFNYTEFLKLLNSKL